MSQIRVQELANELGFNKQELVSKIRSLEIGLPNVNAMTRLTDDEVSRVKKALKGGKNSSSKKAEPATAAAPAPAVRKRSGKKKKEEEPAADTVPVGPVIRRNRRSKVTVEDDAVAVAVASVESTPEPTPAASEPVAEAKTETKPEQAPEPAVVVEASPEPASDAVVADAASTKTEEPAAAATEVAVAADPAATAEAVEAPPAQVPPPRSIPSVRERDAAAAKVKTDTSSKGGAKILGVIDLGTIADRIGERKFKPSGGTDDRNANTRDRPGSNGPGRTQVNRADLYSRGGKGGGRNKRGAKGNRRSGRNEKPKKTEITVAAEHKRVIKMEDAITVGDLGRQMGVKSGHLALKLMQLGVSATVNTTLDFETAVLVAEEFEHTVENVAFDIEKFYDTTLDAEDTLQSRPAVVTVMGHVDHGKTSLLDSIRATTVTSGEAGGITQHIGAYTVKTPNGETVTFLDTPGHEAFTALRARGAQATDIVVLVIAADDGVMPQTVEAINHSRDAGVPIIVAINKIDKPAANPDRIKTALSEYELLPTDWGGSTEYVLVSALQGQGIDELVEVILLTAEVEELKARPDRDAQGLVIESQLDVGRGPLATVLVQRGTLVAGDIVVIGEHSGRVRTMADHRGTSMDSAGPSVPVEITGLSGVPDAGEPFFVVEDDKDARRITAHVAEAHRKERMAALSKSGMDKLLDLLRPDANLEHKKLKLIVKADVQGSIEALEQAFQKVGKIGRASCRERV